jgi:hypothetical protein
MSRVRQVRLTYTEVPRNEVCASFARKSEPKLWSNNHKSVAVRDGSLASAL